MNTRYNRYYNDCEVLVTGGAGFIGSHLTEALVMAGARVTVLDNLSTGSRDNLRSVQDSIRFIEGTIGDYNVCLETMRDKVSVFHCAAQTSVSESMMYPLNSYQTNVQGTYNLLEAARICKIQRFVFSSSCAVYGNNDHPCSETSACNPTSPYGFSKYSGEAFCMHFYHVFGLPIVILRYFNVYGVRQNYQGPAAAVAAKFRYHMKRNETIRIFGDGLQTRDFVPVAMIVQANMNVGASCIPEVIGSAFNIATGVSITLLELVQQLRDQEYPSFNADTVFVPARSGDIQHIKADCSKYNSIFK